MKTQVVVDKKSRKIICTSFTNGKRHDFRLFKESKVRVLPCIGIKTDTGYQGIAKRHANSELPKKRSKKKPLSKEDKKRNRDISSERVSNEHAIGFVKRFRIVSERYRNRRIRFALRFNLIAGICNFELAF
jgi:hypothetical protein